MATIQDRWHRKNRETGKLERTALYGTGKRYRPHFRDPCGREVTKAFDRKIDAQRWLDEQTVALVRGNYVHPQAGRVTVGEWAESWLAGRSHLKPKTLASYQSLLSTRVLPTWERVPLSKVGHSDVVAWVAGMRSEGLSASRTRQAYHVLTSMLDAAVRDGRVARNAAAGVDLPRLPTTDRRYLTHAQLDDLAERCGPHRLLVLVLGYTGLRWGEAAALRGRRMDLLRGRIEVAESVTDVNGRMIFGSPKSHARRWVPILRFLRDDLAVQLARIEGRTTSSSRQRPRRPFGCRAFDAGTSTEPPSRPAWTASCPTSSVTQPRRSPLPPEPRSRACSPCSGTPRPP